MTGEDRSAKVFVARDDIDGFEGRIESRRSFEDLEHDTHLCFY